MSNKFWLTNALLEEGFEYQDYIVTGIKTELKHLLIKDGRIIDIKTDKPTDNLPLQDAAGLLVLPSFTEQHIHLDKGHFGGEWQACTPFTGVFDRIKEEEEFLEDFLPHTQERAEKLLDLITGCGVTQARVHCNVDPVIEIGNIERVQAALENYQDQLNYELVAFPQHGLLRSNSVPLMKEAMRNGADVVGGLDPATIDNNIEESLHSMMDIAVEFDADVDVHLHEPGSLGMYTIRRLTDFVEDANWQGRVTISHGFCLGDNPEAQVKDLAQRLVELDISLATTSPIDTPAPPIPLLDEVGVDISVVNDNINDHWTPFGTGDVLKRLNRTAEKFGWIDEYSLARALKYITNSLTPLDKDGNRQWPQVGDDANFTLVDSSCSAEAVARVSDRQAVMFEGNIISGSLE
ncbi:MAG: amidohydrolase [Bacillota bacterium]